MDPVLFDAFKATAISAGVILAVYYLLFFLVRFWGKKKKRAFPELFDKHIHLAGLLLAVAVIANVAFTNFREYIHERGLPFAQYGVRFLIIIAIAYLLMKTIAFSKDILLKYYEKRTTRDYSLRSVRTKFHLLHRVLNLLIIFLAIGALLMSIPRVREVGNTVLASAGVAGIILGFAAQKSLGTFFAGIQIAITQPIKLGDTIIVDNYFGTVGEITLTYVVLYTWDGKRLIIPINRFLEETTENWTRVSPEVIGQVKIHADYSLPVEEIRKAFKDWIENDPQWDKRSSGLLVTGSTDKTIEIRAHMSAKDSGDAWDLECRMREKLIKHIRDNYPDTLPTTRLQLHSSGSSSG